MTIRLTLVAEHQIRLVLRRSAELHGISAAERYLELLQASLDAIAADPMLPGSFEQRDQPGVLVYSIRHSRSRVPPARRVGMPRHALVYQLGQDGIVDVLGLLHDRMAAQPAIRKLLRGETP